MKQQIKFRPLIPGGALLFAGLLISPAFGQALSGSNPDSNAAKDEAIQLDTFTVSTATRSAKAIDHIPGAVSLVSTSEISNQLALNDDATNVLAQNVPGYSPSSQALANTGETLRGRVPLRLFDGIPVSTPTRDGSRAGYFTDLSIIDRIEVVEGPSATEGLGGAGGIINYISKSPTKEGTELSLTTRGTSQFDTDSNGWKVVLTGAHKSGPFDLLASFTQSSHGMDYDAHSRAVAQNESGSTSDSHTYQVFVKAGYNFAQNQRIQFTMSRFDLVGNGNYSFLNGNPALGLTSTAIRGPDSFVTGTATIGAVAAPPPAQRIADYNLIYNNESLFGGSWTSNVYIETEIERFVAETGGTDKADPLIAPNGTLTDQSSINSHKIGTRNFWVRKDLFNVTGLELNAGVDALSDTTEQTLALTNRLWVPPMHYKSVAEYAQFQYDLGPLTLSAGYRQEEGSMKVNSYTTVYNYGRTFVQGGTRNYSPGLPNFGAVYRFKYGFSVFASYDIGFTLPNIGIALRGVNTPGNSVNNLLTLAAIKAKNKEAGINWRGPRAALGFSLYNSRSDYGTSLSVDPATNDFIVVRRPVDIDGGEVTGEYKIASNLKVTALYSRIDGRTASANNGPINIRLGIASASPDKVAGAVTWTATHNLTFNVETQDYIGRDINVGLPQFEHFKGYDTTDFSMNYHTKYGDFGVGISNVFNTYYLLGTSQAANPPTVTNTITYISGIGRVFSASYTIKF